MGTRKNMTSLDELLSHLHSLGVKLWNDKGYLGYRAPKGVLTPALLGQVKNRKTEILDSLRQSETARMPTVRPVSRSGDISLSFAQQRLWFLAQLEGASATYNISGALQLTGVLDREAMEHSLNEIERRHESLRTIFPERDGRACQKINPPSFKMFFLSIEHLSSIEQESRIQDLARKDQIHAFDLAGGPLWRVTLLRLNQTAHILFVTMHHIIADGWSMSNFTRELSALYSAYLDGKPAELPELPVQYIDFAVCQRKWLGGDILESQLAYWKKQLAGAPAVSSFPEDYPRPSVQSYRGAELFQSISRPLAWKLEQLARQEGVTLFMVLEAAFAILLSRYSGADDVVIGTPIANRQQQEIEPLIGFFVNTLVLRNNLSGNPPFIEFLQQVRQVALDAYQHQSLPFELLVESLQPERSLSQSPLFQVMFILQNTPDEKKEIGGLELTFRNIESSTAKFDLTLSIEESEEGLTGIWEYNTDLFNEKTIQRFARHYKNLLNGILADSSQRVKELPVLDKTEKHNILFQWNDTSTIFPKNKCIQQMFEEQAELTPDATALVFENQKLTYRELNERANRLAHSILELGNDKDRGFNLSGSDDCQTGSNALVGIYAGRSPEMVIGVLAILKAGCAYVPLDPGYPEDRLEYMLRDTNINTLLTQQDLMTHWPEYKGHLVDLNNVPDISAMNPDIKCNPGYLAYVLYTSGSTGKPKGVAMPHRALSNLICWQLENTKVLNKTKTVQFSPISFDVSFQEIFCTWCAGGTLFLLSEDMRRDPSALLAFMENREIDRLFLPFVALRQLAESASGKMPAALREVITAGEQLRITPAIRDWFEDSGCTLHNQYGPAESHVVSSFTITGKAKDWPLLPPIGHPVQNTRLYILDDYLQPVPINVTGELYIGGVQVASGYLNSPDLTCKKFIPNPFAEGRIYKTGDMCRYLPDGNIEYLGRYDHQVKIRGYRVELGEIEALLGKHEAVGEVAVVVRQEKTNKKLVAYLTGNVDSKAISQYLAEKLPDYMIPDAFVKMEKIPMTPSGKVNRKALSEKEVSYSTLSQNFTAPRNFTEQQLIHIWQEVLDLTMPGVQENFFEIGGHSLLAVRLMARIEQHFGINLPLATLFQYPTIKQLADRLGKQQVSFPWSSLVPIRPSGEKIPFFCVPGAGGNVLCFYEMAYMMRAAQPFYGLQAVGLDGVTEPLFSIEDMAAHYIKVLRPVQKQGPYFIGGHSFGGKVAFEMTQQLLRQGHDIGRLIILDADAPNCGPKSDTEKPDESEFLAFFEWTHGESIDRKTEIKIEKFLNVNPNDQLSDYISSQMKKGGLLTSDFQMKEMQSIARIFKANLNIDYMPKEIIPVPITLIRAEEGIHVIDPVWEQDKSLGWNDFADGSVEIISIPGDHYTILAQPFVRSLSEQLLHCIDKSFSDYEDRKGDQ